MPKKTIHTIKETASVNLGNIIAIIVVIALVGLGAWSVAKYNAKKTVVPSVAAAQTLSYDCNEGQTALDILKTQADVKTQDSELGTFVDEINSTQNGNGSFWIFYVNGQMGQVGVDQYNCQAGDKIEWRFEKIY